MNPQATRPEDRRRSAEPCIAWADTLPACMRSEAFAEDLQDPPAAISARAPGARPRWLEAVSAPLMGLTLVGMLGTLGR